MTGGDWSEATFGEDTTLLASGTSLNINSGGGLLSVPQQDMRGFEGYYLFQNAITTGANAYNAIRANAIWGAADDFDINNTFNTVLREDWEWFAQTGAPGAGQEGMVQGILEQQDQCRGNFLNLSWANQGTTNIALTYRLYGTTRPFRRPFQEASPYDDALYENANIAIAGGGASQYQIPLPMYYGRLRFQHVNIAAAGNFCAIFIAWGSAAANFYAYDNLNSAPNPGGIAGFDIVAPRRPGLVVIQNFGAAAVQNKLFITTDRTRI